MAHTRRFGGRWHSCVGSMELYCSKATGVFVVNKCPRGGRGKKHSLWKLCVCVLLFVLLLFLMAQPLWRCTVVEARNYMVQSTGVFVVTSVLEGGRGVKKHSLLKLCVCVLLFVLFLFLFFVCLFLMYQLQPGFVKPSTSQNHAQKLQ